MKLFGVLAYVLLSAILSISLPCFAEETFFEQFRSCVVLIESIQPTSNSEQPQLKPRGTGFWVGKVHDQLFLVSNKHVLKGPSKVALRCIPTTGDESSILVVDLVSEKGDTLWKGHPDPLVDIAVLKVDDYLLLTKMHPKIIQIQWSLFADQKEIVEGDDIFVLGFPLGIRTTSYSSPLLRSGVISLKPTTDFLLTPDGGTLGKGIYLVDAVSLGGNSGSPVFLKPGLTRPFLHRDGQQIGENVAKLVGIVSAHVIDVAPVVVEKTDAYALTNSGLTIVHPAKQILETIQLF